MRVPTLLALAAPLCSLAQALPSSQQARSASVPYPYPAPPHLDPFYAASVANLASFKPGQIIKKRQLPNNLTSLLPADIVANISSTWQLVYRTTDAQGAPAVALATMWVPLHGNPANLLAYQAPHDRANIDCAPSYELQNGFLFSRSVEAKLPANLLPISALNQGYYVVLPDHEGPLAALGSGLTGGYATLDAIRAALASASFTGVSADAKIAMTGYSGGAPPTEFAAELQSSYAPELNIVGAAIGGINPNSLFQLNTTNLPTLQSQNILGQVLGLSNAYANLSQYLATAIDPAFAKQFNAQRHTCDNQLKFEPLSYYFKNPISGVNNPVMQTVWYWGTTWGLRGTPTIPMYVDVGLVGPLPAKYPDGYVKQMCARGVAIQYVRNKRTNHDSEGVIGFAGALGWLQDRFDGVPAATACSTVQVSTTTLAASQKTLYGTPIYNKLAAAAKALQNGAII